MKNKGTILVTGGRGFVGFHLTKELMRLGYPVISLSSGSKKNSMTKGLKFFKLNLLDETKLKKTLKKINPTHIIHLASNSKPNRNPELISRMMKGNFTTTLNLYKASLNLKNLKCLITFGSAGECEQGIMPFEETQKETPASPYSLSKTCVTHLSSYFYRIHCLPIVMVRPCYIYGEYQTNEKFIASTIQKCLQNKTINMSKGEQIRDFIYIKDLTTAIIKIIEMRNLKKLIGEIINICTGERKKLKDIVLLIKKEAQSKSKIKFGAIQYRNAENMVFFGSNKKAKKLLNWSPQFTLQQGIKETIEWHKKQLNH